MIQNFLALLRVTIHSFNQMKKLAFIGILGWFASLAEAATIQIDYSAAPGERNVETLPLALPIPDGNKVAVGTFVVGFDVIANAGSISALAQNWIEFDSKSTRTILGEQGRFSEQGSGDDVQSYGAMDTIDLVGKPIYLWIFKTETNVYPQADFSTTPSTGTDFSDIRGYGLFTAPSWVFPDGDNPAPGNQIILTSDDAGITAINSGALVFGPDTTGALQFVPEPSTASFIGLGLLVLIARRRRF